MNEQSGLSLFIFFAIVVFFIMFIYFVPISLFVTAYFSGVKLNIGKDLIGMRLRKVPPELIVRNLITLHKAGLTIEQEKLEAHYLQGGNVNKVVNAVIAANKLNFILTF